MPRVQNESEKGHERKVDVAMKDQHNGICSDEIVQYFDCSGIYKNLYKC